MFRHAFIVSAAVLLAPAAARAEPFDPEADRPARIGTEAGWGTVGTVAGAAAGAGIGCLLGPTEREWGCLAPGIAGASAGAFLGMGAGIYLGGNAAGANGGYGWTTLGQLAGLAGGASAAWLLSHTTDGEVRPWHVGVAVLFTLAGGIAGYELSTEREGGATGSAGMQLAF